MSREARSLATGTLNPLKTFGGLKMPVRRKNPKKVVNSCQLKKDGIIIVRSECPAIKNVRSIRNRLNALVREQAPVEQIEKMRKALKNAKTSEAKENQCKHCHHVEKAKKA